MIILGSGPNRIGQGIEFDYSCVHASLALGAEGAGYETVMVNCNPETVSTDYDTSDRLYFEPLTLEDVLEVVHAERQAGPIAGVICQLGGQTPLGLAQGLADAGVPIVGTPPEAIHLAEERGAFGRVLAEAGCPAPKHGMASSYDEARRPSRPRSATRCSCGRRTCSAAAAWRSSTTTRRSRATSPGPPTISPSTRCWSTGSSTTPSRSTSTRSSTAQELFLGGVMEHIEEAGIHSGDSACALPPITLGAREIERIREATEAIARGVGVRGLINIQFALGCRRALRPGGQPAGLAHGAVRVEGDGHAAGQGRRPGDARRRPSSLRDEGLLPAERRRRHPAGRRARSPSRRP